MANDTIIMFSCLMAILLLNTTVFFYNQSPIDNQELSFTDTNINQFETDFNETGIGEGSSISPLIAVWNIVKFFGNIIVLLFGWYPSFSTTVNLIIKLGVYTFAIPLFITIIRLIRGN